MGPRHSPLIVLAVVLALAACSPLKPPPADFASLLLNSAQAADNAGTVRYETRVSPVDGDSLGVGTITGVIDFNNGRSSLTVEASGETVEAIFTEDALYLRFPSLAAIVDTPWLYLDLSEIGPGEPFGPVTLPDPADAFRLLKAAALDIQHSGQEDVRGVATDHYRLTVDTAALFEAWGFDQDLKSAATPFTGDHVIVDAWVDDEGLVRRLSYEFSIDEGDGPSPHTISTQYWDYGAAPSVELPDPAEVMDFNDWLESLGDSGSGSIDDYFAGADCYGDDVDNCLQPNPELDAIAADPSLCQGEEARVCLVPVGKVRLDVVQAIVDFHRETAGIEVLVLPSLPLDPASIYRDTSQVDQWTLYGAMQAAYGVVDETPSTFIAITPIDVRPQDGGYAWMFGSRIGKGPFGHNHGVFSYFRMANVEPYDNRPLDDALLHERVAKYAARYVALLHLDYEVGDDIDYLNYRDMFGFSDLDSMGTAWPEGPAPCLRDAPVICIIPDGAYEDPLFEIDLEAAVERLSADLGIPVEIRRYTGYYHATQESWSDEYRNDLHTTFGVLIDRPNVTVIGVTDDAFSQAASVPEHMDRAWPEEQLAVVSAYAAGPAGTDQHEERLYRLLLRGIAQAHFGKALDDNPGSLLYRGATTPADLDGASLPGLR